MQNCDQVINLNFKHPFFQNLGPLFPKFSLISKIWGPFFQNFLKFSKTGPPFSKTMVPFSKIFQNFLKLSPAPQFLQNCDQVINLKIPFKEVAGPFRDNVPKGSGPVCRQPAPRLAGLLLAYELAGSSKQIWSPNLDLWAPSGLCRECQRSS